MAKKNRPKRFYDYSLLFCIIFLSVFGLVMIYSASSYTAQLKYNNAGYFMMRQLKIGAGGLVLALIISKLDYHWYAKFSMFAYLLSYVLMIAVTLVGKEVNGKKRWLGVGSLSFQPTEFVKIALIIFSTIPTAAASFRPLWFAMTVMMIKAIWIQPSWTATGNPTRKICHITFLFGRKSVFFR